MIWAKQVEYIRGYGGKLEGEIRLGRTRLNLEDNIKVDHKEMGWEGVGWSHLAQDKNQWWALANTIMNCRVQ
jgi:hypothetical protein